MLISVTILIAVFCAAMEALATATIMPTIIADLGGLSLYPWVQNSFLLSALVTTPFVGAFADAYGHKKGYLVAAFLFLMGSTLCGFAQTMPQLIAFRILQGIGSASLITMSVILIGVLYPVEKRARMQACVSAMWALASLFGPFFGAYITDTFSWHFAFLVNLPIGILILAVVGFSKVIPELESAPRKIDLIGGALFACGALFFLQGAIGFTHFELHLKDIVLLIAGALCFKFFIKRSKTHPNPFMPISLFERPVLALSFLLTFFAGFFLFCSANLAPLFVQGSLGVGAKVAGKAVMGVAFGSFTGSLLSGLLLNRFGFRWMSLFGAFLIFIGFSWLSFNTISATIYTVMLGAYFIGTGVSTIANANTIAAQTGVPKEKIGIASSMVSFSRSFGGMIGIALIGGIQLGTFDFQLDKIAAEQGTLYTSEQLFDLKKRSDLSNESLVELNNAFSLSMRYTFLACAVSALGGMAAASQLPNLTPKGLAKELDYAAYV